MLEFYMAYADVNQMMDFAEKLLRSVVYVALGHTHVRYGEHEIDFSQPFRRMTMRRAVAEKSRMLASIVNEPVDEYWLAIAKNVTDWLKLTEVWTRSRAIAYSKLEQNDVHFDLAETPQKTRTRDFETVRHIVEPEMIREWKRLRALNKDPHESAGAA